MGHLSSVQGLLLAWSLLAPVAWGGDAGGAGGEWALVTGASSGIGEALAQRAALEGYGVVLHGRQVASLERVAASLGPGARYRIVVADLAKAGGAERLHAQCRGLDVSLVVANAGGARVGAFVDDSLALVDAMVATNVRSTVALCHLFGADLAARGSGAILVTGSLVGVPAHGCAGTAAYAATKAFLRSFGNALHDELRPRGVAVTVVLPGAVDSAFAARASMDDALVFKVPGARVLGVVSAPEAVARAAFAAKRRRRREVVPGLANKAYAIVAEALPNAVGRAVAKWSFGPAPTLGRRAAFAAAPVVGRRPQSAISAARPVVAAAAIAAVGVSAANVVQAYLPADPSADWRETKAAFVATWRGLEAPSPESLAGDWDGELQFLGAAAPLNGFITNRLFTLGGRWLGKSFGGSGDGENRFEARDGRGFRWTTGAPSRFDGKPALVLDYAAAPTPDRTWGTVLRMRDELRELEPGVLLGLGSMGATGGMFNNAPFVLRKKKK